MADVFGPFNSGSFVPYHSVFRADHSHVKVAIATGVITGALVFMLLASKSVAATVVFAVLYGFTSGGCMSRDLPASRLRR